MAIYMCKNEGVGRAACYRCGGQQLGVDMFRDVSGAFLQDALDEATGFEWRVLHTGGGCFLYEAIFPYAWVNGADRLWLCGDDVLDMDGSPESFGSRVWACLMAGGIESTEEDKEEYCVAEAFRDTNAIWDEEAEESDISAARIVALVLECMTEFGVSAVGS